MANIIFERVRTCAEPKELSEGAFSFSVAENYLTDRGDEKTEFFDCIMFGKVAKRYAGRIRKGMPVRVEGYLKVDEYTNKEGVKQKHPICVVTKITPLGYWDKAASGTKESAQPQAEDNGWPEFDEEAPFS